MGLESVLFEDEDDIFMGSPKSKFFDILFGVGNGDLSKHIIEDIIQRAAIMELMLTDMDNKDIENDIKRFYSEHMDAVEMKKKSLFIEYAGEILCKTDS
jgi:hypothetical protein